MVWWLWLVVGGIVGMLLGFGVAFGLLRRRGDAAELRRLERELELEAYRDDVSDHFVRTAELVNALTQDYRAVYEHLESGAYELVGEAELRKRIPGVDADPVMLEYIGRRALDRSDAAPRSPASEPSDRTASPARPDASDGAPRSDGG